MTKTQKKLFKSLNKDDHRSAFLTLLTAQQDTMGKYTAWGPAYVQRCRKKGARMPATLELAH